jgi:hypothetical protein
MYGGRPTWRERGEEEEEGGEGKKREERKGTILRTHLIIGIGAAGCKP